MILFGILVAIASAILIRLLTIRETRPLAELTSATEAVTAGDYSRHVGSSRQDEVGRLARAFDAMTAKVAADITERERIARALHENEERLRYTLSAARVGTWQMNLDTGIVEWSETMGPLFGMPSSALPSMRERVLDVIHPDDREAVTSCLMRDAATSASTKRSFEPCNRTATTSGWWDDRGWRPIPPAPRCWSASAST